MTKDQVLSSLLKPKHHWESKLLLFSLKIFDRKCMRMFTEKIDPEPIIRGVMLTIKKKGRTIGYISPLKPILNFIIHPVLLHPFSSPLPEFMSTGGASLRGLLS